VGSLRRCKRAKRSSRIWIGPSILQLWTSIHRTDILSRQPLEPPTASMPLRMYLWAVWSWTAGPPRLSVLWPRASQSRRRLDSPFVEQEWCRSVFAKISIQCTWRYDSCQTDQTLPEGGESFEKSCDLTQVSACEAHVPGYDPLTLHVDNPKEEGCHVRLAPVLPAERRGLPLSRDCK
jgi:hypothetical protein